MITRRRSMVCACSLMAAARLAQAGDASWSGTGDAAAPSVATVDEGWTAGASASPQGLRSARATLREPLDAAGAAGEKAGVPAVASTDVYGGYRGLSGALGYSALVHLRSYPSIRSGRVLDQADAHGELSAGLNWKSLYARYDLSFSGDYLGVAGARGTAYLDVGANHPIGHGTFLNLHAGDGHVAGPGNALWDWKDLRAGFSRKLEDGWMMVLNVRRVYGNSALADRRGAMLRSEGHNPALVRGHRGLVLTFNRGF